MHPQMLMVTLSLMTKKMCVANVDLSGDFVSFEPVTLVPFEPKLIDFSLMTVRQIEWFNDYNKLINTEVLPLIEDTTTSDWIQKRTKFVNPASSNEVQKWLAPEEVLVHGCE